MPLVVVMVSLLLPGPMEADQWLHKVRASRHMWPLQMTSHAAANQLATNIFMRRERRRLQARHIWGLRFFSASRAGFFTTEESFGVLE